MHKNAFPYWNLTACVIATNLFCFVF